ncbi:MAG: sugar phosphate isomerase/epimerase family protein [Actinomycetota bacterium]
MTDHRLNRRVLLGRGMTLAFTPIAPALLGGTEPRPAMAQTADPWRGLKLGVASYTLRKLPLDDAIKAIQQVGLKYVSIKDSHLPLKSTPDERKAAVARFKSAGITVLSCGVITTQNDEAGIRAAFEYARDAGIPTIVGNPDPASISIVDRMVKEFDIRLAIHNHGPGDKRWPSPYDAMKLIEPLDRRIGVCIDVGHTARVPVDPAEAIRKCQERLFDVHLKDIHSTNPDGRPVEGGRGALDLAAIMKALVEIKYQHLVGIEYEKDPDDPIPGLAETVGYTRGILTTIR